MDFSYTPIQQQQPQQEIANKVRYSVLGTVYEAEPTDNIIATLKAKVTAGSYMVTINGIEVTANNIVEMSIKTFENNMVMVTSYSKGGSK